MGVPKRRREVMGTRVTRPEADADNVVPSARQVHT